MLSMQYRAFLEIGMRDWLETQFIHPAKHNTHLHGYLGQGISQISLLASIYFCLLPFTRTLFGEKFSLGKTFARSGKVFFAK